MHTYQLQFKMKIIILENAKDNETSITGWEIPREPQSLR